jgi:hypothetical protein
VRLFRDAPSNQRAPGIARRSSTRSYGRCEITPQKSQIEAQNASSSFTDQVQSAS